MTESDISLRRRWAAHDGIKIKEDEHDPNTIDGCEALALHEEDQARKCLKKATHLDLHGREDGRCHQSRVSDLLRWSKDHAENAISYRRIAASMRRREQRRAA